MRQKESLSLSSLSLSLSLLFLCRIVECACALLSVSSESAHNCDDVDTEPRGESELELSHAAAAPDSKRNSPERLTSRLIKNSYSSSIVFCLNMVEVDRSPLEARYVASRRRLTNYCHIETPITRCHLFRDITYVEKMWLFLP